MPGTLVRLGQPLGKLGDLLRVANHASVEAALDGTAPVGVKKYLEAHELVDAPPEVGRESVEPEAKPRTERSQDRLASLLKGLKSRGGVQGAGEQNTPSGHFGE